MAARIEPPSAPIRVQPHGRFEPTNHRGALDGEGLVPLVKRMMDGLEHLISAHLELVRIELKQDAKQLAIQLGKVLAFLPLMLSGLIVLVVGVGFLVGTRVGLWQGLVIVGGATLVLSSLGFYLMLKSFRAPKVLEDTKAEAKETAQDVKQLASPEPRHAAH